MMSKPRKKYFHLDDVIAKEGRRKTQRHDEKKNV
jgi:hypothetical protein